MLVSYKTYKETYRFNFNEDNNEITFLRHDISKLNFTDPMDVSEYLNFTEEKIIEQIIDENESTEIIEGNSTVFCRIKRHGLISKFPRF